MVKPMNARKGPSELARSNPTLGSDNATSAKETSGEKKLHTLLLSEMNSVLLALE